MPIPSLLVHRVRKWSHVTPVISGIFRVLIALVFVGVLTGCATYASRVRAPREAFEAGNYSLAIEELQSLAERKDTDELLYWMDLGLVHHSQGNYLEAIQAFQNAEKLSEVHDYTSLSEEAGSVILSDEVVKYNGEDFEKLLVNVYLAIDYTLLGQLESALVEARKVNHKLDLMISKGKLPYEQNVFAKYLAAVLFEAQGEWNDAFVDYRQLLKWKKGESAPYLAVPLLRLADKLQAQQELVEYRVKFPGVNHYRLSKKDGEVVVVFEQGKVPIKVPSESFRLVPRFQKRLYRNWKATISSPELSSRAQAYVLFDIEATAIKELEIRMAGIVAKKIAGIAAKEAIAEGMRAATKDDLVGAVTRLFLHAQDQADLRSWSTLPARLQIARLTLPAGRHDIVLDMVDKFSGQTLKHSWPNVEIKGGNIVFLKYRALD